MPTFNFFRVYLKCFNVLRFGPRNTINPGSLLVNYVLTKNTLKRAATWAIGPGSSGPFGPGWWDEPGPMGLAPGPPPLVSVGGLNRDQRLPFSPGSCHQPGPMRCLYIPPRARAGHTALFFLAEGERAWWCSSSPPMHTRCLMECLSHTT